MSILALKELNESFKDYPRKVEAEDILKLNKKGMLNKAIADKLGVSRERVRQILKVNGIVNSQRGNFKRFVCSVCGKEKTLSFKSSRSTRRNVICKDCNSAKIQKLRKEFWAPSLRLKSCIKCGKSSRRHVSSGLCSACYQKTDRCKKYHREWSKKYFRKNRVKIYKHQKEYFQEYKIKNKERLREKARIYYHKHRERLCAYQRKLRQKHKQAKHAK